MTVWKLCAVPRSFQSQQSGALTRMWRWCQVQPSQKESAIGVVHCKKEGCYCNLSVGLALKVRFTTNGMCARRSTQIYVARTSNNRVISSGDLYCCLLPQCEALRTCHSSFLIATQEKYFLVFRLANTWKWPEMNMNLDLNLVTNQSIDGFGGYNFWLTRFGLELMTFFWTSSQLSVQFWDCRLL